MSYRDDKLRYEDYAARVNRVLDHIEARGGDDFEEGWNRLYRDWLSQSGYEPDSRPCLEIYRKDPQRDGSGKYVTDICVPLK